MSAEEELALLMATAGEGPVETAGTAALLEAISGRPLVVDVVSCPAGRVPTAETALLRAEGRQDLHVRAGVLRCGTVLAAQVTAVVVTGRVPARARVGLGITRSGRLLPVPGSEHLGRALHGLGVRRDQHELALTPASRDVFGERQVLRSSALLLSAGGAALAWTVERIYAGFLEAFPPPWDGLSLTRTSAVPRPGAAG